MGEHFEPEVCPRWGLFRYRCPAPPCPSPLPFPNYSTPYSGHHTQYKHRDPTGYLVANPCSCIWTDPLLKYLLLSECIHTYIRTIHPLQKASSIDRFIKNPLSPAPPAYAIPIGRPSTTITATATTPRNLRLFIHPLSSLRNNYASNLVGQRAAAPPRSPPAATPAITTDFSCT